MVFPEISRVLNGVPGTLPPLILPRLGRVDNPLFSLTLTPEIINLSR